MTAATHQQFHWMAMVKILHHQSLSKETTGRSHIKLSQLNAIDRLVYLTFNDYLKHPSPGA